MRKSIESTTENASQMEDKCRELRDEIKLNKEKCRNLEKALRLDERSKS